MNGHSQLHSNWRTPNWSLLAPTIACRSISSVSCAACTREGSKCVGAQCIRVTRRLTRTFIDICRQKIMWDRIITTKKCCKTCAPLSLSQAGHTALEGATPKPSGICTSMDGLSETKGSSPRCLIHNGLASTTGSQHILNEVQSTCMQALTSARHSVSPVSHVAFTFEGSKCVDAGSTRVTRRLSHTFIDICTGGDCKCCSWHCGLGLSL